MHRIVTAALVGLLAFVPLGGSVKVSNDTPDWQPNVALPLGSNAQTIGAQMLAHAAGTHISLWSFGTLRNPLYLQDVVISVVDRTAGAEGIAYVYVWDSTAGAYADVARVIVLGGVAQTVVIPGPVDAYGPLLFLGASVGDSIALHLDLTDVVGVGSYDVTVIGQYRLG